MKHRFGSILAVGAAVLLFAWADGAGAQVTVASGYTPPDDNPSVNVGGTIFADYTYIQEPTQTDAAGDVIHFNGFNLTRAYINVTGQINHLIQFRITPDVVRIAVPASGAISGLTGTLTYRLKYGYGQLNFSDFTTKGSWFRLGLQQTPYVDFEEGIYRYRFAGTIFTDRQGYLTSSDLGASVHWNIPDNYGDFHAGVYNGDGYTSPQINDQVAFQVRGTIRPAPDVPILKGLRLTGFYDDDHYIQNGKKQRVVGLLTFENPYVNFGFQYNTNEDQRTSGGTIVKSNGYSVWATPRTECGLEALLRWDRSTPDNALAPRNQRIIVGPAYWFPVTKSGVAAAVMIKWEQVKYNAASAKPTEESLGLFTLFNF
jgi:hypothetical protein